jgi:hypothetical protein
MIRRLIARSIVVAGFAAIIGIFWHEYGIEALGVDAPVSFSAQTSTRDITGQFKPGPQARRAVTVDLASADVRALRFSSFSPVTGSGTRDKVRIGKNEISEGTVITAVQSLHFFIRKEGDSTYGAFPYGLRLTALKLADAEEILLSDSETPVRAVWTKEELGLWSLKVKGAPASTAKASIMASEMLPVISQSSPALLLLQNPAQKFLEPIPMVVYQDGHPMRRICLDFSLANNNGHHHVVPGRSNRFLLAELDLGDDGKKIWMKFDVDQFKKLERSDRADDSCKGTWSKLYDREQLLDWYRAREPESLETILWAQHETR